VEDAAGRWVLVLRWASRVRPKGADDGERHLRDLAVFAVEGTTPVRVTLPDGQEPGVARSCALSLAPYLFEDDRLHVALETLDGRAGHLDVEHRDPAIRTAIVDATGRGRALAGAVDLSGRVGFLTLAFRREGARLVTLTLEVFPYKLDYRRDFETMLADLGGRYADRILELLRPTWIGRRAEPPGRPRSLVERFGLFETCVDDLLAAVHVVAKQPHHVLGRTAVSRPIERLRRPHTTTRRAIRRAAGRTVCLGPGAIRLPPRLPEERPRSHFDTAANRFVRHVLEAGTFLLRQVKAAGRENVRWRDAQLQARTDGWLRRIDCARRLPFLAEASRRSELPDLVVQRAPAYRRVLERHRTTLLAFSLLAGDIRFELADLDRVYELWAAARVETLLGDLLGPGEGSLLAAGRGGLPASGAGHEVRFDRGRVTLGYQRTIPADPELGLAEARPDLILSVRRARPRAPEGAVGEEAFAFILDAKYRLSLGPGGQARPVPDALNAIHRYRDALLSFPAHDEPPERWAYGGAILFPHPDPGAFVRGDPAWRSLETIGIGAIPLLPGAEDLLRLWLARRVLASDVALHRQGPGYPSLVPPARAGTVLIGPTPHGDRQAEQVIAEGWYHVPSDRLRPDRRKPTHLALYEAAVAEQPGRIRHLLPIAGWREVEGSVVAARARFGDGAAGRRPRYWWLELDVAARALLDPPILDDAGGFRGPAYVPLAILDVAETTLALRADDPREVPLVRLLAHLRRLVRGECRRALAIAAVEEPLVWNRARAGRVVVHVDRVEWTLRRASGSCSIDDLVARPVSTLLDPWRRAIQEAVRVS